VLSDCLNCTIHGNRIELVPQRAEHAEEMFSILSNESLYEFTDDAPIKVKTVSGSARLSQFIELE
jgi:hypothetical protein